MRTVKNYLIIALMFLMTYAATSQEQFSVAVYQDVRLLITGDNKGNEALTPNLILRAVMQGNQQTYGYLTIFPEFEYAKLHEEYYRYSANIGYTLNRLLIDSVEMGCYAGWGMIKRNNTSFHSFGASGVINYKLNDTFKLSTMLQLTERKDIDAFRFSGFIGLEIKIK